jgi:HEAT repeat protein
MVFLQSAVRKNKKGTLMSEQIAYDSTKKRWKRNILMATTLCLLLSVFVGCEYKIEDVEATTDQAKLAKIVLEADKLEVRLAALWKLNDQISLTKIALEEKSFDLRNAAMQNITDQVLLAKIVLDSKDQKLRNTAVEKITDEKILENIAVVAKDNDVRFTAAGKLNDQAMLAKIAIEDDSWKVRYAAAKRVSENLLLEKFALESKDWEVRRDAVKKITDQNLLAKIAIEDKHPDVRAIAAKNLTEHAAIAMVASEAKDWEVRRDAVKKITDQGLLAKIAIEGKHSDVCGFAANKLTEHIALAKVASEAKDSEVRHAANQRMAVLFPLPPPDTSVDKLIIDLKNKNTKTRLEAMSYLGTLKDPKSVLPLIEQLSDAEPLFRSSAARTLGKFDDPRIVKPLCKSLEDKDWSVKNNAMYSLIAVGTQAVRCLIDSLNSTDWGARSKAAEALGSIKNEQAITPLKKRLKDKVFDVREKSAKALEQMHWQAESLEEKIDYYIANHSCNSEARKLGVDAVKILITQLQEKDPKIREISACALGYIGDKSAISPLVNILTDWYSNESAAIALGMLSWEPSSNKHKVRLWVAQRDGNMLRQNWQMVKTILLNELLAEEYAVIENALYAFTGIGNDEILGTLVDQLNKKGNKLMAEAYLNCGNIKLVESAKAWAKKQGYTIRSGFGHSPIAWGSM